MYIFIVFLIFYVCNIEYVIDMDYYQAYLYLSITQLIYLRTFM